MNRTLKTDNAGKDFILFHPELGRLFTSFSWETRNPLQSIWGALAVIQRRADSEDEYLSRAVGIIEEEIGQLNRLIQEYLELVRRWRPGAGRQ
jgi:signal transduction histidine kinase